mmetsp:Transcript_123555/g.360812  ORF Transcript_123555/g.360812 Transcript_123555/m.360812 type:complete len:287 (+) Transcript_123555:85-945(+)
MVTFLPTRYVWKPSSSSQSTNSLTVTPTLRRRCETSKKTKRVRRRVSTMPSSTDHSWPSVSIFTKSTAAWASKPAASARPPLLPPAPELADRPAAACCCPEGSPQSKWSTVSAASCRYAEESPPRTSASSLSYSPSNRCTLPCWFPAKFRLRFTWKRAGPAASEATVSHTETEKRGSVRRRCTSDSSIGRFTGFGSNATMCTGTVPPKALLPQHSMTMGIMAPMLAPMSRPRSRRFPSSSQRLSRSFATSLAKCSKKGRQVSSPLNSSSCSMKYVAPAMRSLHGSS